MLILFSMVSHPATFSILSLTHLNLTLTVVTALQEMDRLIVCLGDTDELTTMWSLYDEPMMNGSYHFGPPANGLRGGQLRYLVASEEINYVL